MTLSTTAEEPTYTIDITQGALSATLTLKGGDVGIPVTITPSSLGMTLTLLTPKKIGEVNVTSIGPGTKGTRFINKDYPIDTGLGYFDKHKGQQINLTATGNLRQKTTVSLKSKELI